MAFGLADAGVALDQGVLSVALHRGTAADLSPAHRQLLAGLRYALSHPNIPWAVNERAKLLFAYVCCAPSLTAGADATLHYQRYAQDVQVSSLFDIAESSALLLTRLSTRCCRVILRDQAVKQGHLLGDLYARDRLDTRVKRRGKQSSPVPLLLRDPPAWEWVRLDGPYEPNVLNVLADLTASRPLLRKLVSLHARRWQLCADPLSRHAGHLAPTVKRRRENYILDGVGSSDPWSQRYRLGRRAV